MAKHRGSSTAKERLPPLKDINAVLRQLRVKAEAGYEDAQATLVEADAALDRNDRLVLYRVLDDQMGIRRSRGKFDRVIDGVVWNMSLDAGDDFGDTETFSFYARVTLGTDGDVADAERVAKDLGDGPLTWGEKDLLRHSYAAMVETHSSGAVYVRYFDTQAEFDRVWNAAEAEWNELQEQMGEDDY